jgi:hypothetical protein
MNTSQITHNLELASDEVQAVIAALDLLKKRLLHTVDNPFGETIPGEIKNKRQLEIIGRALAKVKTA